MLRTVRRLVPALWCGALLAMTQACDGSDFALPESWSGRERMVVQHPSGLTLELPEGLYAVEQTPGGFRIQPRDAERRRSPFEILVEVARAARVDDERPRTRRVQDREARYRVDREDGGSGGELHILRAWVMAGEAHLTLEQRVEAEPPAEPDFSDGWAILELARLP